LAITSVVAQSTPQQEINEQIWKRFVDAYGNQDAEAFMKIHSEKLVRNPIGYEVPVLKNTKNKMNRTSNSKKRKE
jgi:hypothetical protein